MVSPLKATDKNNKNPRIALFVKQEQDIKWQLFLGPLRIKRSQLMNHYRRWFGHLELQAVILTRHRIGQSIRWQDVNGKTYKIQHDKG